jgi:hypothetical protein
VEHCLGARDCVNTDLSIMKKIKILIRTWEVDIQTLKTLVMEMTRLEGLEIMVEMHKEGTTKSLGLNLKNLRSSYI